MSLSLPPSKAVDFNNGQHIQQQPPPLLQTHPNQQQQWCGEGMGRSSNGLSPEEASKLGLAADKPVRVVRVVHYIQAPPGGLESLSPEQQQLLIAEAKASIAQQQQQRRMQQQHSSDQVGCFTAGGGGAGPQQCSTAADWSPAAHTGMYQQQQPQIQDRLGIGSIVMLAGEQQGTKCALRVGEAGRVVDDDGSSVPFAVQGPRGDVDWYQETDLLPVTDRKMNDERQYLGDQLFARIADFHPATAAKVTGMLLDGLDERELAALLVDPVLLRHRVEEAHVILQTASAYRSNHYSSPQQQPQQPPPPQQLDSPQPLFPLSPASPPDDSSFFSAGALDDTSSPLAPDCNVTSVLRGAVQSHNEYYSTPMHYQQQQQQQQQQPPQPHGEHLVGCSVQAPPELLSSPSHPSTPLHTGIDGFLN